MNGGLQRALSIWLAGWLAAWRGLADNPFREYLELAHQRRIARVPPLRRYVLGIVLGGAWTVVYVMLWVTQNLVPGEELQAGLWFLFSLLAVLYVVTLLQAVFESFSDCLGLLSARRSIERYLAIDDMLAVTALTDKDLVFGALSIVLPPLASRAWPGALLCVLGLLAAMSEGFTHFSESEFWQVLTFAPLTIASMTLCGVLGATLLCLCMLCFGLNQVGPLTGTSAAAIHAVSQLQYPFVAGMVVAVGMFGDISGQDVLAGPLRLSLACALLLCHVLFIWGMLALSARHLINRSFWLVASPFLLPLCITILFIFMALRAFTGDTEDMTSVYTILNLIWSWGSLAIVNPLAQLGAAGVGADISEMLDKQMLEWYRYPLLVLLQLVCIGIAARYAELAVSRRRQANV